MVASLHTITHSRPEMRPTPVMMPAPWMSFAYMSSAASGDSSRNGEPGSISRSTRSRGSSLPRATWRSRCLSGPPAAASARLAASSATSARMAAALALNSSDEVEIDVLIFGIFCLSNAPCSLSLGGRGREAMTYGRWLQTEERAHPSQKRP